MSVKSDFLEMAEVYFLMTGGEAEQRYRRTHEKPGEAFAKLSPETREQLKQLRSDDVRDVRWPPWDLPRG